MASGKGKGVFIGIAGTIGVGKTTTGKVLSWALGIPLREERVRKNPLLSPFYAALDEYQGSVAGTTGAPLGSSADSTGLPPGSGGEGYEALPKENLQFWAFNLQHYFLHVRSMDHIEIVALGIDQGKSYIQDRTVYEDAVFEKTNYLLGNISERDHEVYTSMYHKFLETTRPPDLIIDLKASVPAVQERIRKRGRKSELSLAEPGNAYLERLGECYKEMMASFDVCPVLTVDTTHRNFARRWEDLERLLGDMKRFGGVAPLVERAERTGLSGRVRRALFEARYPLVRYQVTSRIGQR
ncbi:deoxynucleoside kinase [Candidatus Woesearchaeota archaeon]|nr:deoxynucleoside kinase [Candidatus Woesearchaeota archaeon]